MKTLVKTFLGILTVFTIVYFTVISTIRFQLLNSNFLVTSLRKPGVYTETERALRVGLKQYIESQIEKEAGDLERLTVGERAQLDTQIDEVVTIVTAERIQDFTETNITRVFGFMSGTSDRLLLYVPLERWGLAEQFTQQGGIGELSEETDILEVLKASDGNSQDILKQIQSIKNLNRTTKLYWFIGLISLLVLLILHILLSKKSTRLNSFSKLLIISGSFLLLISLGTRFASDKIADGLTYYREPTQIIAGAILPALLDSITKLWLAVSSSIIIFGLLLYGAGTLQKRPKKRPKPLAPQPQKR